MAVNTVDLAFIEEFEAGVHEAYQRMGSYLRHTLRYRGNVKNKTTFQKVGIGSASQKARNGDIPPMRLDHSVVDVTLQDWYAGDWVDDLDLLRTNNDELVLAQEAGARALGRKSDELIITAWTTTTNAHNETTNGATYAWALQLQTIFGDADIPMGNDKYCVVSWQSWEDLMGIDQFMRSEYVGNTDLIPAGVTAKRWLDFNWMPFSGLTNDGSNRKGFAVHKPASGLASGQEVQTSMQFYNTKHSWFVNNSMQMNAVLIDAIGVRSLNLKN